MRKQQHKGPCDFAEGVGIKAEGEWEAHAVAAKIFAADKPRFTQNSQKCGSHPSFCDSLRDLIRTLISTLSPGETNRNPKSTAMKNRLGRRSLHSS